MVSSYRLCGFREDPCRIKSEPLVYRLDGAVEEDHVGNYCTPATSRSSNRRRRRREAIKMETSPTLISVAFAIFVFVLHRVDASSPRRAFLVDNIEGNSSMRQRRRWLQSWLLFRSAPSKHLITKSGFDLRQIDAGLAGLGSSTTASTVTELTDHVLASCRGGSVDFSTGKSRSVARILKRFFSFRPQTAAEKYRETLEDQVLLMDRQLRQTRDELAKLREQWSTKSSPPDEDAVVSKASKAELAALKQQVLTLTEQVNELTKMKEDLQNMLEREQAKVVELEDALAQERQLTLELQEGYELQLQELQAQLEKKAQQQMDDLRKLMEKRVEQAAETARIAAQKMVQEQIELATAQLKLEQQRELDAERKRSEQAVEVEKRKMRKLVKALAIREKKILAKRQRQDQRQRGRGVVEDDESMTESKEPIRRIQARSKTRLTTQPKRPPTTRGPMR